MTRAAAALVLAALTLSCMQHPHHSAETIPHVDPARLVQEHPRLFVRKSDLPRIRQTIASLPDAKKQYESLLKGVDLDRPVAFPTPGKPTQPDWVRVVEGETARAARCAFVYQVTGEPKYAAWSKEMLLAWADNYDSKINFELCSDFNVHEPGHVGNAGNTMGFYHSGNGLTNLAMAYDCIYDTLNPAERRTIEDGLFRKWVATIERFDYSTHAPQFAPDFMVNGGQWNGANLCNMGLTAVGFLLHEPRLYDRGIKNFKLHLQRDMLSDGFWVEEDRNYSDTCMMSLFNIAWMAKTAGYPEDLFHTVVQARPVDQYDRRYADAFVSEDGAHHPDRSLDMYLDAQLDYQYPTLAGGNWGWYPNTGAVTQGSHLLGMYTLGYAIYGKPAYGFILQHADQSRAALGAGVTSLLYFGKPLENIAPPETKSRVYPHGRWIALKSIEGKDYWNSDALYAFMSYSAERNKPIQPLSLDIFGFGKVLAPRVGIKFQAQSLTTDYQLTEPAWNNVLTDGRNSSLLKEHADRAWMAWQDLGTLVKIVAPRIHYVGGRQSELYQKSVERHPEEDRTVSRILAMTDKYLVDVTHVTYDRPPLYHHNFDFVQHGYGKLTFEGLRDERDRASTATAVWTQPDGVGLRSTFVPSKLGSGTKYKTYTTPAVGRSPSTELLIASRAADEYNLVAVHEPVKGPSRLKSIELLAETKDHIVLQVIHNDGTKDFLAIRTRDTKTSHPIPTTSETLTGNYLFLRTHADGKQERQQQ